MTGITLECFTAADLPQLLAVTESAAWLHSAEDWRAVLHAGVVFGHRCSRGEVISTTAIFSYGTGLSSVGMVIVKPPWRGRGLAKTLMLHALAFVPAPAPPIILIATPDGFPLYQRLGFKAIARVRRMMSIGARRDLPREPRSELELGSMREGDVNSVRTLDAAVIGAERPLVLDARLSYARRSSVLRRRDGAIVGFALATPQRGSCLVGPVIAPDVEAAAALIAEAAAEHEGPVRVDVPTDQTELAALLATIGFDVGDDAPLMIYGGEALPGDRRRLFGIANRAFC